MTPPPWLKELADGVELSVVVQPRASRSRVVGEHGGLLKLQLAAPPVDGEANECLVDLVSELLDVPRQRVELIAGQGSRRKRVRVRGVTAAAALAVLNSVG